MVWELLCFLLGMLASTRGEDCPTREYDCSGELVYPNFDGSCNNAENPLWGATEAIHLRLVPAEYGPQNSPRGGAELPSPRFVANRLGIDFTQDTSDNVTRLHVAWGQFLSHDISRTPMVFENGKLLECECDNKNSECMDILIGNRDLQRFKKCFSLQRSREAVGLGCKFSQREQFNEVTSYIDASQVYGSTVDDATALRDPDSPEYLKTEPPILNSHLGVLPTQDIIDKPLSATMECPVLVHKPQNAPCLVAGDLRVNENTILSALHTLWVRYHNLMAERLKKINPDWDPDTVYNEARMIVIASHQLITYREYLPPLLGDKIMRRLGLHLANSGYWEGYDDEVNPTVVNAFPTASFRYGHSMYPRILTQRYPSLEPEDNLDLPLVEAFFNNVPLIKDIGFGVGGFMRGAMMEKAQKMDSLLVKDLRNKLFREFDDFFGADLLSFNIQRGRDHGLPGYNHYRALCGLKKAESLSDLRREIDRRGRIKLKKAYNLGDGGRIDDIDLYPGGISENSVPGGQLGPTFACLMGHGFRVLRRGNRFWHENKDSPSGFTIAQLSALRQTTLASVICEVAEDMEDVKLKPLLQDSGIESCDHVPKLDLSGWNEIQEIDDRANQDESVDPADYEWTRWFVKPYDPEESADELADHIRAETDGEVCDPILDYEDRNVEYGYHQYYRHVRFACAPGAIKASDFPVQISDQTCFSDWKRVYADDDGVRLLTDELCDDAIHLQARVAGGGPYARESGDVFESYSVNDGFTCVHAQQLHGFCQKYKVRALCRGPCDNKKGAP